MRWALLLLLGGLVSTSSLAATVVAVVGDVQVVRSGNASTASVGTALREGDELVSRDASEAVVRFDDGGRFALRAASRAQFRQLPAAGAPDGAARVLNLVKGALRYVSALAAGARGLQFETNTATIGIRGTDIEIAVTEVPVANEPPGTLLRVRTGLAFIRGTDGTEADVRPGQVAYGGEPDAPTRGLGSRRRPGARLVSERAADVFVPGRLDAELR
jgi:hypothetical protein